MDRTDELDAVIPGVSEAYASLRTTEGSGIFTSNGAFYNHTFFGRDSSMAAKFMVDHDHTLARQCILFLASLQGARANDCTQEQFGRIYHELRNMRQWRGSVIDRLVLEVAGRLWGMRDKEILTYFAVDTTASFIRLVNKYAENIDQSILGQPVTNRGGIQLTVGEAVAGAADWLLTQIDERDLFVQRRTNRRSLPFQIFQDSITAYGRTDNSLAHYKHDMSYVEAQAFAADALDDAARLLGDHERNEDWRHAASRLGRALTREFWMERDNYFASAIDRKGQIDMHNISPGWALNVSLWHHLPEDERAAKISAIVRKLFSDDFLTPVGLRTRSLTQSQVLPGVVEYHGSNTVWPMFTFMVIEGLRRHRLYRLADELQNRLINGLNASGEFDEFFIVDPNGTLLRLATGTQPTQPRMATLQMRPEKHIAFSVVPALTMAYRVALNEQPQVQKGGWQAELECSVLQTIPSVPLARPEEAGQFVGQVEYIRAHRWLGNIKSTWYYLQQSRNMS